MNGANQAGHYNVPIPTDKAFRKNIVRIWILWLRKYWTSQRLLTYAVIYKPEKNKAHQWPSYMLVILCKLIRVSIMQYIISNLWSRACPHVLSVEEKCLAVLRWSISNVVCSLGRHFFRIIAGMIPI